MSSSNQKFTFEKQLPVPPAQVYRAFTNATAMREWLCDVATCATRPGGHLFLAWNSGYHAAGNFTDLEENRAVSFTWLGRGEPGQTQVRIELSPDNGGSRLILSHQDIGEGPAWSFAAQEIEKGWRASLENLASVLTTGEDLRFVRRPMLGITVSDFDAAIAALLGVPVEQGIRLDNVVPGLGAAAAGLQGDDVVVQIGEHEISDWNSLTTALGAHRVGDAVEVVFYRGAERRSVTMTLSRRPLPDMPDSVDDLAAKVADYYAGINASLDEFMADVTVNEATFRPGPESWTVRDVLAHLIHAERGHLTWMGDLLGGHEAWYDDFGSDTSSRLQATATALGDHQAMLDELKRLHAESAALIAHLPADFAGRKSSFWRLAMALLQPPYHIQSHLAQMRAAVTAAREQIPA